MIKAEVLYKLNGGVLHSNQCQSFIIKYGDFNAIIIELDAVPAITGMEYETGIS